MAGKEREERDSRTHERSDKSPVRSEGGYRDRSQERMKESDKDEEPRGRSTTREEEKEVEEVEEEEKEEEEVIDKSDDMMKMMGFGSFESTKGRHVEGVGSAVAKKNKSTKYRQYMNREKGFNRALSPGRNK